tara:strand:+ start:6307 stop:6819 length:513 start_codon:yes stop_codon:yes gene_type:complete
MYDPTKPFNILHDRDNTLIKDYPYQSGNSKIEILRPALSTLQSLSEFSNFFVITNQSDINRGFFSYDDYSVFTNSMINLFGEHDIRFAAVYFCPHRPEENCNCRKPKPGLYERVSQEFNVSKQSTFMIGDKPSDMKFAENCNLKKSFLINSSEQLLSWQIVQNYFLRSIK